jgi:hypothetical protein
MLSSDPGRRAALAAALYDPVIPAVDAALAELIRIHSADSADELTDLTLLQDQWGIARNLLNPAGQADAAAPDPTQTAQVSAAFDALGDHIDELITRRCRATASSSK